MEDNQNLGQNPQDENAAPAVNPETPVEDNPATETPENTSAPAEETPADKPAEETHQV